MEAEGAITGNHQLKKALKIGDDWPLVAELVVGPTDEQYPKRVNPQKHIATDILD